MLGKAPWARLSPSGPAVLLLVLCAGVTTQDICSSPGLQEHGGNDQTPFLYLNASSAKEGEIILFQCVIDGQFPATRVVFCKNGQEEFSLKAEQGKVIYALVLNITSRSAGTYKCGYQQRNESNWVRNSALSAPRTLSVPGSESSSPARPLPPGNVVSSPATPPPTAPNSRILHTLPTGMALAVAAVSLVLLAAGSWFAIRKGACRGRCPRQQHVDSPQEEDTNNDNIQYSTIAHVRRDRPRPVQQMSDTTTYATVTHTPIR